MVESETPTKESLKWGSDFKLLSDERKDELAQRLWAWNLGLVTSGQPGPFAKQPLNGLEVFWLAACALAEKTGNRADVIEAEQRIRGERYFDSASFPGLFLQGANLSGARMQGAYLIRSTTRFSWWSRWPQHNHKRSGPRVLLPCRACHAGESIH